MNVKLYESTAIVRVEVTNDADAVIGSFVAGAADFGSIQEKLGTFIRDTIAATLRTTLSARLLHEAREQGQIGTGLRIDPVTLSLDGALVASIARELANNAAQSLAGVVELIESVADKLADGRASLLLPPTDVAPSSSASPECLFCGVRKLDAGGCSRCSVFKV